MKIFSRNAVRGMAAGGVLLVAMGSTAAYAGGSTSTKLDNGRLYFEAHNGRDIGQSSSKVYWGEKYTKTGGSPVTAQLTAVMEGGEYKGNRHTVKKGQSITFSWSAPVSRAEDCTITGIMITDAKRYQTPWIENVC